MLLIAGVPNFMRLVPPIKLLVVRGSFWEKMSHKR